MKFTNSPLVTFTLLSPNHSGFRIREIDRITPHCVVGHATVEGLGELFANPARQASSNYGIDDRGHVGLYVEEDNRSWCSSSSENDQRAVTIEVASDTVEPYRMTPTAYNRLIDLCTDICQRYGKKRLLWIPDKDTALSYRLKEGECLLTVHRWFANKSCPGDWLFSRLGDVAKQVTERLAASASSIPVEGKTEQTNEDAPSPWAKEAVDWAIKEGILLGDGTSYRLTDPVTREEMLVFLKRALKNT